MEAEEIIALAKTTVWRMEMPYHLREEAAEEAIITGLKASREYDCSKGAAERSWVILNMRWGIRSYLEHEARHKDTRYLATRSDAEPCEPFTVAVDLLAAIGNEYSVEWETAKQALATLDERARRLLLLTAQGYRMATVSRALKMQPKDIGPARAAAILQLKAAMV